VADEEVCVESSAMLWTWLVMTGVIILGLDMDTLVAYGVGIFKVFLQKVRFSLVGVVSNYFRNGQ